MGYTHSKYQLGIFDFIRSGNGHGEIIAGAGSAKTYTGVESTKYIPRGMGGNQNVVFLAFNKSIQLELERKLENRALAKTYHSFGLSAIPKDQRLKITEYKNSDLLQAKFGPELKSLFPLIGKITGLFKGDLRSDVTHETVNEYIGKYDLNLDEEQESYFDEIVDGVAHCLDPEHITRIGKLDFDDMIWYPLVQRFHFPKVDHLLVDEYQDTNFAQAEMVFRCINGNGGRIITIGDPNQAIYYWRGAGSDSMEQFANRARASILPLSITYRCPRAVVRYVNTKYPEIPFEVWDQAIEGSVNEVTEIQFLQKVLPGDMVVCRMNAPLVKPAMKLLREGRKVIIKGKDIGENLITLIHQVQKKYHPLDLNDFLVDLDEYSIKESEKMRLTNRHGQADLLEDKVQTIYAFSEGADTVDDIKNTIRAIFSNNQEGITFSSGHRSKGLEAPNVYQLMPELFLPSRRDRTPEAIKQARNLNYVVDTRSKVSLNFVRG